MPSMPEFFTDRRALIAGLLASLSGGSAGGVRAEPGFKAPVVDQLTLQVLIDNATFGPFLPNLTLPGLEVRRETGDRRPRMSRQALKAERRAPTPPSPRTAPAPRWPARGVRRSRAPAR
jgi:7,8-dihydropterin-6-yl-methyl-4-(beta-D-ribofuranosyl)aminobenzene 5'-phosphate synthase